MSIELIFPSVGYFKGLLDHLKSTNGSTNSGIFIFTKESIRYQSIGFGDYLMNDIYLYPETLVYEYSSEEDEVYVSVNIIDFRTILSGYNKKNQLKIEKNEDDQYITIMPLNENSLPVGHESRLKIINTDLDVHDLPEYNKTPNFLIDTNVLSKNLSSICVGSKNPVINLYCNKNGILFEARHNSDTNISRYTIGKTPSIEDSEAYSIRHDIIKSLGKLGGVNKEKMTRIYYKPGNPLRLFVPIGNDNGELNICINMDNQEDNDQ